MTFIDILEATFILFGPALFIALVLTAFDGPKHRGRHVRRGRR